MPILGRPARPACGVRGRGVRVARAGGGASTPAAARTPRMFASGTLLLRVGASPRCSSSVAGISAAVQVVAVAVLRDPTADEVNESERYEGKSFRVFGVPHEVVVNDYAS